MSKIKNCYIISRDGERIGNETELADLDGYAILPVENLFRLVVERDDFPEFDKHNMSMIIQRLLSSGRIRISS